MSVDAGTMTAIRAWKRRQVEERLAAGPAWVDTPYVFTRENGAPPHPGWVTKRWNEDVAAVEVPAIRLHDARHTAATIMLRAKVPVKVRSERLGHHEANVAVTYLGLCRVGGGLELRPSKISSRAVEWRLPW